MERGGSARSQWRNSPWTADGPFLWLFDRYHGAGRELPVVLVRWRVPVLEDVGLHRRRWGACSRRAGASRPRPDVCCRADVCY
jgi:hypothetical protein